MTFFKHCLKLGVVSLYFSCRSRDYNDNTFLQTFRTNYNIPTDTIEKSTPTATKNIHKFHIENDKIIRSECKNIDDSECSQNPFTMDLSNLKRKLTADIYVYLKRMDEKKAKEARNFLCDTKNYLRDYIQALSQTTIQATIQGQNTSTAVQSTGFFTKPQSHTGQTNFDQVLKASITSSASDIIPAPGTDTDQVWLTNIIIAIIKDNNDINDLIYLNDKELSISVANPLTPYFAILNKIFDIAQSTEQDFEQSLRYRNILRFQNATETGDKSRPLQCGRIFELTYVKDRSRWLRPFLGKLKTTISSETRAVDLQWQKESDGWTTTREGANDLTNKLCRDIAENMHCDWQNPSLKSFTVPISGVEPSQSSLPPERQGRWDFIDICTTDQRFVGQKTSSMNRGLFYRTAPKGNLDFVTALQKCPDGVL